MLFQGTSNRDSLQINRFIGEVGGRVGAFTTRDYTSFVASVLGDYSYHALDLLGDLLLNSTFPQEHIERERQAIACEIQADNDVPQHRTQDDLKRLVWPDHALGRPIAGDPRSVARLTREDAIYFVHRQYTPDRMTIAAVGAVNHDDYVAQARDVFWRLFGVDNPAEYSPVETRPGFSFQPSAAKQSYFCIGIPCLPYTHKSRYAIHVLNEIIGGGSSSRLFQKLQDEAGLVYEIRSEYHAYRDAGLIVIAGSTVPENLKRVVSTILAEVHSLAVGEKPADEEEVSRSKTRVRTAADGFKALAQISEQPPDAVLLDVKMPGMDGYQVCKIIKANRQTKDVPIVMISGSFIDKVRGRMAGCNLYIEKPFSKVQIPRAIAGVVWREGWEYPTDSKADVH